MSYDKEIARCEQVEDSMAHDHDELWQIYLNSPSQNMEAIIIAHGEVRRLLAQHRFTQQRFESQRIAREEAGGDG